MATRGIKLRGRGPERCGACPRCGGDDRFSINTKKQVWNCRGCASGGDVIKLVEHLDGSDFKGAVETLAGAAPATKSKARPSESASYDPRAAFEWAYHDESNAPLFRSVRTPEKKFWQSPADGNGGWVKPAKGCMEGVRLVPLYLPEVLAAIRNSGLILIAEGERKVDLLRHLGFVATCNVSGAIRSKLWVDHAKEFFSTGCYAPKVIVLPDNDDAGRKHADTIGAAFAAVGVTVHILDLPWLNNKEDVLNWYDRGGTREQLDALIASDARPWEPSKPEYPPDGPAVNAERPRQDSYREQKPAEAPARVITFTPYVWQDPATLKPRRWLYGKHYVRKFLSTTIGAGGGGKSSLALVESVAMATGINLLDVPVPDRLRVAYWGEDPEDEINRRVGAILKHFKITREQIEGWLFVDSFRNLPLTIATLEKGGMIFPDADAVTAALIAQGIDVLILDPFVKTHGVSENDNGAIERVARKLNDIAEAADCSIEAPQHIRKASNFGRSEVTVDDGRGAGSLKDAARCVRVMNRMTTAEAPAAQVKEKDRKRYFRVDDDGKANMTAPAEAATWFKLISVPLENDVAHPGANGDEICVVTSWQLPGVFAGLPPDSLARVQAQIDSADWGYDQRSGDWAGKAIAAALDLDLSDEVQKERVKGLLQAWKASGALKVLQKPSLTTRGRDRDAVVVGNRVEGAAAQDELDF